MATNSPVWSCYGPLWSRMILYGPVWSHMVPNGPKWFFMVPHACMVLPGPMWSCEVLRDPEWSCMDPYGLLWVGTHFQALVPTFMSSYHIIWVDIDSVWVCIPTLKSWNPLFKKSYLFLISRYQHKLVLNIQELLPNLKSKCNHKFYHNFITYKLLIYTGIMVTKFSGENRNLINFGSKSMCLWNTKFACKTFFKISINLI